MLTLMAARAGAARVVTCEYHPVVAEVARDIVAKNGYADKVSVVAKGSNQMRLGSTSTSLPTCSLRQLFRQFL